MIVFCTKNPKNLLMNLDKIYKPFIVQITLTPYGKDIEPNVPPKKDTIEIIKKLSKLIGNDKIFLRYDPIIVNEKYDIDFHIKSFKNIVEDLEGYTNTVIVSFVDMYKNVRKNYDVLNIHTLKNDDYEKIGINFSTIASNAGMTIQTCAEEETLFEYGFLKEDCVSKELVYKICGKEINKKWKARTGKNCNCVQMYDIGEYNTCKHGCKYCYANYNEDEIKYNVLKHDSGSPILLGKINLGDVIKKVEPK